MPKFIVRVIRTQLEEVEAKSAEEARTKAIQQVIEEPGVWTDTDVFVTNSDTPYCPDWIGHDLDFMGCGSTHIVGPDSNGLYDCLDCGVFFNEDNAFGPLGRS